MRRCAQVYEPGGFAGAILSRQAREYRQPSDQLAEVQRAVASSSALLCTRGLLRAWVTDCTPPVFPAVVTSGRHLSRKSCSHRLHEARPSRAPTCYSPAPRSLIPSNTLAAGVLVPISRLFRRGTVRAWLEPPPQSANDLSYRLTHPACQGHQIAWAIDIRDQCTPSQDFTAAALQLPSSVVSRSPNTNFNTNSLFHCR
jgi:hypothetical protein